MSVATKNYRTTHTIVGPLIGYCPISGGKQSIQKSTPITVTARSWDAYDSLNDGCWCSCSHLRPPSATGESHPHPDGLFHTYVVDRGVWIPPTTACPRQRGLLQTVALRKSWCTPIYRYYYAEYTLLLAYLNLVKGGVIDCSMKFVASILTDANGGTAPLPTQLSWGLVTNQD